MAPEQTAVSSADPGRLILLDGQRWSTLLVLLSLDVVIPHCARMRLQLPGGFVPVVRDVILRHASVDRQPSREPSYFVPESLEVIARTFNEETCVRFIRWGRTIFTYTRSEHPTLKRWCDVLNAVVGDEARWRALRLPSDVSDEARRRFASVDAAAADSMADPDREQPLSDWDVCLYALRGFDDDDRGDDANRPTRWVEDTIRTARRLEYWRWLLGRLSGERQRALQSAASGFAGDEPLRHPRLIGSDDE
jgi:hypothetical protein